MKTSGIFETHSFNIPCSYGKEVRIICFGDVHWDSPNHADAVWQEDLEYFRKLPKDSTYFIGMGDYLDSTSTTERECLGQISKQMHETFKRDTQALQQAKIDKFSDEISFMKGRLIGLLNGNHYFEFQSGINGDQKLADKLDCKYLGVCALIRLSLVSYGRTQTLDIFAHHGMGASRLIGGSINRVAQMFEGVEADIAIMGHDHKRGAMPTTPRLFLHCDHKTGALKVKQRESWAIRSGSYLASFRAGESNYNVDACRMPSSLGHVEVLITLHNRGDKEREVETQIRCLA
jgi:predicted phosphodiesterase